MIELQCSIIFSPSMAQTITWHELDECVLPFFPHGIDHSEYSSTMDVVNGLRIRSSTVCQDFGPFVKGNRVEIVLKPLEGCIRIESEQYVAHLVVDDVLTTFKCPSLVLPKAALFRMLSPLQVVPDSTFGRWDADQPVQYRCLATTDSELFARGAEVRIIADLSGSMAIQCGHRQHYLVCSRTYNMSSTNK
jgi:hypothetical protein